jgi:hypothetical protein
MFAEEDFLLISFSVFFFFFFLTFFNFSHFFPHLFSTLGDSKIPVFDTPDRPYSLYEGMAGMGCLLVDILSILSLYSKSQEEERDGKQKFSKESEKVLLDSIGFPGFEDM